MTQNHIQITHTMQALRVIYEDLMSRGLKDISPNDLFDVHEFSKSDFEELKNFNPLLPSDSELLVLFKHSHAEYDYNNLFKLCKHLKEFDVPAVLVYEECYGDGNDIINVFWYTTLNGQEIYLRFDGTYSSWDDTTWHSISYVKEPIACTAYDYKTTHSINI